MTVGSPGLSGRLSHAAALQQNIYKREHEKLVAFVGGEEQNHHRNKRGVAVEVKPFEIYEIEYAV